MIFIEKTYHIFKHMMIIQIRRVKKCYWLLGNCQTKLYISALS